MLDLEAYRSFNVDLRGLSDEQLVEHFTVFGADEGRRSNGIGSRDAFAALIPSDAESLEIGPFFRPLLRGPSVRYFDVLPQAELVNRAQSLGAAHSDVPPIDFVSPDGDLLIVDARFDYVLSSHCIEHQPDFIAHLHDVAQLLRDAGRYFVLLPDKRYCFDHFIAESTLAEVLAAHEERRHVHSLRSIVEHRALTTHNDSLRHWTGDHGSFIEGLEVRAQGALNEYRSANGSYIDVHAWYFTPLTAQMILSALFRMGEIDFELEALYPTRFGANEFWLVLRKRTAAPAGLP